MSLVPVVALTGGIAAGKSVVTDVLRAHGVTVIDADEVARAVVEPGQPALEAIRQRFGEDVLDGTGHLNRQALAQLVFGDEAARADLNAIVHPAVWQHSREVFQRELSAHPAVPLVYAIPLLVEGNRVEEFDRVVVVHAPEDIRLERLVHERGMEPEEALRRVRAQASDQQRLAVADVILDSSGSLEGTRAAAEELADSLLRYWPNALGELPARLPTATR